MSLSALAVRPSDDPEVLEAPLTPRQKAFVREYIKDHNGTQSAIRAGYSIPGAAVSASLLLTNVNIRAAVERAIAERDDRVNATKETVLAEMGLLAHSRVDWFRISDAGQVEPTEEAPVGAMGVIQSIKRKVTIHKDGSRSYECEIKLWDKPNPLKLMGKHVGLFRDKLELTGPNGTPLNPVTEVRRTVVKVGDVK